LYIPYFDLSKVLNGCHLGTIGTKFDFVRWCIDKGFVTILAVVIVVVGFVIVAVIVIVVISTPGIPDSKGVSTINGCYHNVSNGIVVMGRAVGVHVWQWWEWNWHDSSITIQKESLQTGTGRAIVRMVGFVTQTP
jgi:hypothetical protein